MGTLHVVGNVNIDVILGPQTPWPEPGTEVQVPHRDLRAGGSTGNTALALQALGATINMVCNCGTDPPGQWLREEFGSLSRTWASSTAPTALTLGITHPNGERTFFSHLGHLAEFSLAHALSGLQHLVPGEWVLLSGVYQTPELQQDYLQLLHWLKNRKARIAIDPGWPPQGFTPELRTQALAWFSLCDDVLVNEIEAISLTEAPDVQTALLTLAEQLPDTTVIVKCGPHGVRARSRHLEHHVSAPQVQVIDTVGAGDTFNAAYLLAKSQGKTLLSCLEQGVHCASAAISTFPRMYQARDQTQTVL
ncbi:carbohydrate kinase family protein [Deinococcus cellulosilyticus]|uniref:Carbohydrate kinase n=1 Tax=Deinococcus cellulosilyticus (strain DSM 18568 / NBRC 106333 / KACC 11606 / 5516J-15) TaxID=1223518 RepID=A0A511N3X8_DEIC1|nr:carbohydrate kinase family protein [Deinococcus cellulosilyticus]GEM47168.1 carbohydrate kinase [Deinococcus cellulosilyticus NBRC 106333 = KACC 11606]